MAARSLIAGWFDAKTKARFASAARAQGLSESALLKRLIDAVLLGSTTPTDVTLESVKAPAASGRLSMRVPDADLVLLKERAQARGLPISTYVTFFVRAHLRAAAAFPAAEFDALRASVLAISAIGRNLNQIARALNSGNRNTGAGVHELHPLVLAITKLREQFRGALEANRGSWSTQNEKTRH